MGSEWPTARLGSLCLKIGSGATPRGGKESYKKTGISLIRSQNVHNNRFEITGLAFIDEEQARGLSNVEVKPHDVLLNITGDSVARACQVPDDMLPARVNQHVAIIRPDSEHLDPGFVRYWLVSPQTQAHLLILASAGATRNGLTKGMIENLELPLPGMSTQRRIAHILGTLDDKIELNRRMNETLEAMAQALFKSWFVDFDPVIDKALAAGNPIPEPLQKRAEARKKLGDQRKPLPASIAQHFPDRFTFDEDLGWIPEGWETASFGNIAEHVRVSVAAEETSTYDLYVGLEHIGRRQLFLADSASGDSIESNKTRFHKNDLLFGKLRPYFHKVCIAPSEGICSTDILVFRAEDDFLFSYMTLVAFSEAFVRFANACSTGTRMPRASAKDMLEYAVPRPSADLLRAFESTVKPVWSKGMANVECSHSLAKLRDTLLPKLLSGELRIPDAEKQIEKAL